MVYIWYIYGIYMVFIGVYRCIYGHKVYSGIFRCIYGYKGCIKGVNRVCNMILRRTPRSTSARLR